MKTIHTVQKITISNLLCEIMSYELCPGLEETHKSEKVISHVIPCRADLSKPHSLPFITKTFNRDSMYVSFQ